MKRSKFTDVQIIEAIKRVESGVTVQELCRELAIRCDNGPEYVGTVLNTWAAKRGIRLEYIQPGKPQQKAYIERLNRTARHEWLS